MNTRFFRFISSRLIPQSLVGRVIGLLLLVVFLVQGTSALLFFEERDEELRSAKVANLVTRTASIIRLLNNTPPTLQTSILQAITTPGMHFWISDSSSLFGEAILDDQGRSESRFAELITPDLPEIRVAIEKDLPKGGHFREAIMADNSTHPHSEQAVAIIAIKRPQGEWLNSMQLDLEPTHGWVWTTLLLTSFIAGTLAVLFFLLRRITRPLARLTAASDQLGRGEKTKLVAEEGPEDMKRTIRAFNLMQERLLKFVQDRTTMLAAISHDLRTPLTSLRLRAELIDDADTRKKIIATVTEMQQMTETVLEFARDDSADEDTHVMDLVTLVDSLCQDMQDLGSTAYFTTTGKIAYSCRPVSLRRALRNLIENAVAYGDNARVSIESGSDNAIILIEDDGPGIPIKDIQRLFEPFARLDESRSKVTGGIGLGLSIARSIIHAHGGDIALSNKKRGGLCVAISLPFSQPLVKQELGADRQ
ncbi:MAG: signal transduction histidine kinase [Motiliproteus sp.]|jgi:signal transduction histidine kinase